MRNYLFAFVLPVISVQCLNAQSFTNLHNGFGQFENPAYAFGDYDNDGDPDLVLTGFSSTVAEVSVIYRNEGGGNFTLVDSLDPVVFGAANWGDYDGDGDLDLLINGQNNSTFSTSMYRNDGSDVFTKVSTALPNMLGISRFIDYDGDGKQDVIISGYGNTLTNDSIRLYHNDGGGVFTEVPGAFPGYYASDIAVADYDSDGDLDFFMPGADNGPTVPAVAFLFTNTGGSFSIAPYSFKKLSTGTADWGDYDNDGDLDLIYDGIDSTATFAYTVIYRNNGAAGFAEVPAGLPGSGEPGSAQWGDVDNDGDLDVLLGDPSILLRNNGGDVFVDMTPSAFDPSYSNQFVDMDMDGDLDICINGNTIVRNDSPLGVQNITNQEHTINVFPNPSTDIFSLTTGLTGTGSVFLTNGLGEIVLQQNVQDLSQVKVNVGQLSNGVYLVKVKDVQRVYTGKVIVSH